MSDKQEYIEIIQNHEDVPLFFRPWWLDAVCINVEWNAILAKGNDGKVLAAFVYTTKSRFGIFRSINMPSLSPYLGVIYLEKDLAKKRFSIYSNQKKILTSLAEKLPKAEYLRVHLHPSIKNTLGLLWRGYKSDIRYTYRLSLDQNIDAIYNSFKGSLRTDIKKAAAKLTVSRYDDPNGFFAINRQSFERQGIDIPYSKSLITNIFKVSKKNDALLCLKAADTQGNIHAAVLIIYDRNCAYCIATGADINYRNSGAISLLLYECIKSMHKKVKVFDFEGGNMESIEMLYRSFGGELTSYISLVKTKNRFWRGIAAILDKL